MQSPEEAQAVVELKAKIAAEQIRAWNYLRSLNRMDTRQLTDCGYRNGNAEAMRKAFNDSVDRVNKLELAFLRAYPD